MTPAISKRPQAITTVTTMAAMGNGASFTDGDISLSGTGVAASTRVGLSMASSGTGVAALTRVGLTMGSSGTGVAALTRVDLSMA